MYCPKCGTFNPNDSRFCESCGSPLSVSFSVPSDDETVLLSPQKSVDIPSSGDKTIVLTPSENIATPPVPPRSEASASSPATSSAFSPAFQPASVQYFQYSQPEAIPNQNPGYPATPAMSEKPPKPTKPHKSKKPLVWVLVILLVLAGLGVGGWFGWNAYQGGQYQEQLSLGEKYLKELNYEDAIIALNRAIEIDPRSPEPYLLLADVYVGQEDFDSAKKILEEGYQATGGNEDIRKKQEEVKQKEEEKKQEELSQNAEDLYADYLQNTLIPQYGLAKTSVSGTKHVIEDKWFDMSGIMTAKVLDLDNDGMSELLTVRMEAKAYSDGGMYEDSFDHTMYLDVYQIQKDGIVTLAEEQPLEYYGNTHQSKVPVTINSICFSDMALHLNLVETEGKKLLVVEYEAVSWFYVDSNMLCQWTLEYQDGSFHRVNQLEKSAGGTSDIEYSGYEFQNDQLTSQELLVSFDNIDPPTVKPPYDSLQEAVPGFWDKHGISAVYHDDKFRSMLTDENQITPIMDFLIVCTQEEDSFKSAHMTADIIEQADLQTLQSQSNTESQPSSPSTDEQDYILAGSDSRYISKEELDTLTKQELVFARNEIYARHGRKFNDPELREYFMQFDWYTPTVEPEDFNDSMLNKYEVSNIDLIVAYEKEKGYK